MSELKQEDIDAIHQHQYTIPVEWEEAENRNGKYMSVIRLACACGAEKERR